MDVRKARLLLLRLSAVPFVLLAVFVRPTWPVGSPTAFGIEFGGYLFLLAGLATRMWAILHIGGRKTQELVTDGPYSLCRNPLYVGTFLLVIGAGLCFENVPMLAATLVVFVPMHVIAVRLEERHLEARFGEDYARYRQTVPRFAPRFRNYRRKKVLVVPLRTVRRIMVDTILVLLVPETEDLLEVLHANGWVPVLWHFP